MTVTYRVNKRLAKAWSRKNLPKPERVLANAALISERTAAKVLVSCEAPGHAITRKAIADAMQLPEADLFRMTPAKKRA
jgi:hypothetical protein